MRTNFRNPAHLLTATMAVCGLGAGLAHAQTADSRLNLFMSTVQPPAAHTEATAGEATTALRPATPTSLSLGQLEMGLRTLPLKQLGHGSGASLMGGAVSSSNPSPSIHGFCYEACATARAVASCGTSFPSWEPAPSQTCNPVIDTTLMESMIGPRLGVGQSPFVDYNTGADGAQPAGYTFFGQFIDHDVTRTQADMSAAEELLAQAQSDPSVQGQLASLGISTDLLTQALADATSSTGAISVNTSKLDLDSVYGVANYAALTQINAPWFEQQDGQYTGRFALRHVLAPTSSAAPLQIDGFDYERQTDGSAEIPDPRNSEHKILGQLQGLFELAHNNCMDETLADQRFGERPAANQREIQAAFDSCHNKVKWTYETIVATDFLPRISAEAAISRIAPNALHHYDRGSEPTSVLPRAGEVHTFVYQCKAGSGSNAVIRIPHEFSVAGFRLGHSLVRDDYVLHQKVLDSSDNLLTGSPRPIFADATQPATVGLLGDNPLQAQDVIDWSYFFDTAPGTAQASRPLDTLVSDKLFSLPVHALPPGNGAGGRDTPSERNLGRRNILRASMPTDILSGAVGLGTGEAEMAYALVRIPGMRDTRDTVHSVMGSRLISGGFSPDSFAGRTPLWLYILAEAEAMQDSRNLGELGSHIVDEFLLGGLQCDRDSVLYAKPRHMKGWGPTETIAIQHRYSLPELITYVQSHATVDGRSIRITSRVGDHDHD